MTDKKAAPIGSPPGRIVNKTGVAQFFDVSLPCVDGWIRRGLPAIERGTQGKPWRFDLLAVTEWRFSPSTGAATEGDPDPDSLDPKARLDWYRGTREKMRHQQEAGELISVEAFRQGLARPFKLLAHTVESLPDILERDAGLSGTQVELCVKICDRLREDLYQQLIRDPEE
ncbi:MAG: DUF1441 family protein [Sphingobacteriia bacterium]|nr:DUF1441 family protein [Sphingobacteriia bacterium]